MFSNFVLQWSSSNFHSHTKKWFYKKKKNNKKPIQLSSMYSVGYIKFVVSFTHRVQCKNLHTCRVFNKLLQCNIFNTCMWFLRRGDLKFQPITILIRRDLKFQPIKILRRRDLKFQPIRILKRRDLKFHPITILIRRDLKFQTIRINNWP